MISDPENPYRPNLDIVISKISKITPFRGSFCTFNGEAPIFLGHDGGYRRYFFNNKISTITIGLAIGCNLAYTKSGLQFINKIYVQRKLLSSQVSSEVKMVGPKCKKFKKNYIFAKKIC